MSPSTSRGVNRDRPGDETGSMAVEFAFIAPALLLALMAMAEIGLMAYGQIRLEAAVHETARLLRLAPASLRPRDARSTFCDALDGAMVDCGDQPGPILFVQPTSAFETSVEAGRRLAADRIDLGEDGDHLAIVGALDWRPALPGAKLLWSGFVSPPQLTTSHVVRRQHE